MIPVSEALAHLFALIPPQQSETVPLRDAAGRVMSAPVHAARAQPPFSASSMDGYAVKGAEVQQHAVFKVIGEAAAGHGFDGQVRAGQAVRIFTGAPLPQGSDWVVIQEDVQRSGDLITLIEADYPSDFVRPKGLDFQAGAEFFPQRRLNANDIALLAAMNVSDVPVYKQPVIAIIPTGDELVQPGETPAPHQIIASNTYGLAALLEARGAQVRLLPIARDTKSSLQTAFSLASSADLVVTIGGASVGDHDLVADVASEMGITQSFYKIAMRPGKPLMAGQFGSAAMVGLPGNPVSAMVCGVIFLCPMIDAMQGLPQLPTPRERRVLAAPLSAKNGPREHYMRAKVDGQGVTVFDAQDSSTLSALSNANALAIRPPNDPPRAAGEAIEIILLSE